MARPLVVLYKPSPLFSTVYWSSYVQRSSMQCRACNGKPAICCYIGMLFKELRLVDCQVNNWGNWGACDGSCHDTTIRWRYRTVSRNKYGNGNSCPSTSEDQRCYIDSKACKIGGVCYADLEKQSSTGTGNGGCQVTLIPSTDVSRWLLIMLTGIGVQQTRFPQCVDGRFGWTVRRHASVHKRRPV